MLFMREHPRRGSWFLTAELMVPKLPGFSVFTGATGLLSFCYRGTQLLEVMGSKK
jgi:hypothetical protein